MDATSLAACVRRAQTALAAEQWAEALDALEPVVFDPDLIAANDLTDVRARLLTWAAQAHLACLELPKANRHVREAMRVYRDLGDESGLQAARALSTEIFQAGLAQRQEQDREDDLRALADQSVSSLLEGVTDLEQRALKLAEKSNAELLVERAEVARRVAAQGLEAAREAGSTRGVVLCSIALARAEPDSAREHLVAGWEQAEQAGEFNLVTMIARAAEVLDVTLPALYGPGGEMS